MTSEIPEIFRALLEHPFTLPNFDENGKWLLMYGGPILISCIKVVFVCEKDIEKPLKCLQTVRVCCIIPVSWAAAMEFVLALGMHGSAELSPTIYNPKVSSTPPTPNVSVFSVCVLWRLHLIELKKVSRCCREILVFCGWFHCEIGGGHV